jgi:hypothetical protein
MVSHCKALTFLSGIYLVIETLQKNIYHLLVIVTSYSALEERSLISGRYSDISLSRYVCPTVGHISSPSPCVLHAERSNHEAERPPPASTEVMNA